MGHLRVGRQQRVPQLFRGRDAAKSGVERRAEEALRRERLGAAEIVAAEVMRSKRVNANPAARRRGVAVIPQRPFGSEPTTARTLIRCGSPTRSKGSAAVPAFRSGPAMGRCNTCPEWASVSAI